jgi:hypothetical protein
MNPDKLHNAVQLTAGGCDGRARGRYRVSVDSVNSYHRASGRAAIKKFYNKVLPEVRQGDVIRHGDDNINDADCKTGSPRLPAGASDFRSWEDRYERGPSPTSRSASLLRRRPSYCAFNPDRNKGRRE